MGFFSSQITKPNFDYISMPYQTQVAQANFEGQVQAFQSYMDQLRDQYDEYRKMAEATIAGLKGSADDAYKAAKSRIDRDQEEFNVSADEAKVRTTADARFRGLGSSTIVNQLQDAVEDRRQEGLESFSQRRMDLDAKKEEMDRAIESQAFAIRERVNRSEPIMLNPGPQLQTAFLQQMLDIGRAGQDKEIVVGEEAGFGGLLLSGLGAGAGFLLGGPSGAQVGLGLGSGLAGGLDALYGAPGFQQQGAASFMSGLLGAGSAFLNENADFTSPLAGLFAGENNTPQSTIGGGYPQTNFSIFNLAGIVVEF